MCGSGTRNFGNMKILLALSFLAYANAQLKELVSGQIVHLGPYDAFIPIGNLTGRYKMTDIDRKGSLNARNLIEEIRKLFRVGFYTLPPLDPYRLPILPTLSLDEDFELISGHVALNNLVLSGAVHYKQNLLEIRFKTGRVDFGFNIPNLILKVDLDANLLLAHLFPVNLSGELSIALRNVSVLGAVHVTSKNVKEKFVYQIVAQHIHVSMDDVVMRYTEKRSSSPDTLMGPIGGDVHPDIYAKLKEHIHLYVARIVLKQYNDILTGPTVDQVLAYLLPEHIVG